MKYLILKILLICLVTHNPTDSLSTSQLNSKKLLNKEKCTKIYPKKFVGYVPFGNRAAGNFTKVVPEEGLPMTVEQCVQTCCNDESCNIVFMYRAEGKIDCFLVQCDSNEKCRPVYRDDELRVQVSMVLVRPVTPESSWIAVLPDNVESPAYDSITTPDHPMSHDLLTHCTLDTGCPENQYCDPTHFTCECKPGFEREQDISTTFGRLPFGRGFDSTNPRAEDVYGEESANGRLEGRVFGREPANGREGGVYRRAADSANERVERNDWAREELPNERIERLVFGREGEESTNHRIEKRVFGNEGKASANHRIERHAFGNEGKEPANHRIERRVFESEREGLANQEAVYGRRKRGEGMCLPVMDESRLISSYVRAQTLSNDPPLLSPIYSEGAINPHQSLDHLNPSMSLGPDESKELSVSVRSKVVKLPENEVQLSSFVVPVEKDDPYQYQWTLLSSPEGGAETSMMDQNKATLRLRKLIRGVYVFRVNVTAKHASGHATGNVTVLPADRINQLPKAIINPSTLTVKLPNTVAVLDGTPSTDDDHIISYRWELQQGPLEYKPPALMNVSLLKLDNLNITGNYTFKLSVEDSNHEFNSTTANITVTKVPDYPPEANAGSDVILYLPNSNVTLNGNMSTDDHGLVSYEWTLRESLNQHKPVDMQKSKTPYLQLSNLELGTYTFTLKVTDGSNQSSTSDVHVFVKVASHQPPHAQAGGNYTVILPTTWVMLDATRSRAESDGVELVNFTWVQRAGPSRLVFVSLEPNEDVSLNSSSNMKINATNLTKGIYRVELIVRDINGNSASDVATIQVLQNGNQAPKANAGDNMILYSPQNYIILNGSKSSDDLRIVRYVWTRDPTSNAMGDIIMNSDTQPVLILTNIVIGRYMFKLTVYDDQGLHSDDTVSINVKPDPLTFALTTLTLNIQASLISQSQASSLLLKLNLLLNPEHRVVPRQWSMDPDSKLATLTFLVNTTRGEVPASGLVQTARGEVEVGGAKVNGATRLVQPVRGGGARNGGTGLVRSSDVVGMIRDKLRLNRAVLDLDIVALKTFVCQNPCSGHGKCIEDTRICLCDSFWMRNLYARALTYDPLLYDDNCAWSILYVILALMLALTALLGVCACVCFRAHGGRKVYRSGRSAYKYKTMDKGYKEYKGKGNREEGIRLSTFPGTSSGEEESGGSSLEEFDIRNVARPNGVAKKMSMKT